MKKLLPILVLILIGCSEPEPINIKLLRNVDGIYFDNNNKPYSGKVFRLYSDNSGDIWIQGELDKGLPTSYQEPVNSIELNIRNGTLYRINSQTPFTGNYYTSENNLLYEEGSFKNGLKDKFIIGYYKSGQVSYKLFYIDGEEWGRDEYYENGQPEFITEKINDSYSQVIFKSFFENGQLENETYIVENELNGPTQEYYENGQLKVEYYYNSGEVDGEYKSYNLSGNLKKKELYESGSKIEEYNYYDNGNLFSFESYETGIKTGPYSIYYENGQLKEKGENLLYSKYPLEKYYENGQIEFRKNSVSEDYSESYYPNGDLKKKGSSQNYIYYYKNDLVGNHSIEYRNGIPYNGTEILELGYSGRDVFKISTIENGTIISKEFKKFNKDTLIINGFYNYGKENSQQVINYVIGKDYKHGIWKYYDNDGILSSIETYQNDKLEGPYEVYYSDGRIKEKGIYSNGRIIESQEY